MLDYEAIYRTAYEAFLKTCQETGDTYKKLSWFVKNRKQGDSNGQES